MDQRNTAFNLKHQIWFDLPAKAIMVVVPPQTADREPVSKSSAITPPREELFGPVLSSCAR